MPFLAPWYDFRDFGNAVARLEGRVALEELVARLGKWEVDESSIVRNQLVPGRGVASANIRFKAS